MYALSRGVRTIKSVFGTVLKRESLTYNCRSQELFSYVKYLPRSCTSDAKHSGTNEGTGLKPVAENVDRIKKLGSKHDHFAHITWQSGRQSRFPLIFLRENCKCPSCYHSVIKQRVVVVTGNKEISTVLDSMVIKDSGKYLECCWSDGHVSQYHSDWLHYRCLVEKEDKGKLSRSVSIVKDGCELLTSEHNLSERAHDYEVLMNDDRGLLHWMYDLHCHGLTLINNAPVQEGVLWKLGKRIGHHRPTIHGEYFDIKDDGNVNLSYTNIFLPLHTDLPQMIHPPDLQALHCIRAATEGGVNSFMDGFKVALTLKEENPDVFDILTSTKVPRHDNAVSKMGEFLLDQSRAVITLNDKGQLDKIYYINFTWADYFEDMSPEEVLAFYHAKAKFQDYLNSKELTIRHKLKPGEIAIFANDRILHGRDAFSGEARWLQGIYYDWDPIVSRIKVLNRKFGYPLPFKYHTPPHYS